MQKNKSDVDDDDTRAISTSFAKRDMEVKLIRSFVYLGSQDAKGTCDAEIRRRMPSVMIIFKCKLMRMFFLIFVLNVLYFSVFITFCIFYIWLTGLAT